MLLAPLFLCERVHSECRCQHWLHSSGKFDSGAQFSAHMDACTSRTGYNQICRGHVDGTSREVRVGPIEGPLCGNTYMPPFVQHPAFSGYASLHFTTQQLNPGSVAEQGGAKVLPQVCGPQWDIFNLQATWQFEFVLKLSPWIVGNNNSFMLPHIWNLNHESIF